MSKQPIELEFFMPSYKARGKNNGDEAGAGTGGVCICPQCGYEIPHKTDQPCNEMNCPKCGAKMTRGKISNQGDTFHPDPDWMHELPGYQDEVKIHEELAKKYAKDEGEV